MISLLWVGPAVVYFLQLLLLAVSLTFSLSQKNREAAQTHCRMSSSTGPSKNNNEKKRTRRSWANAAAVGVPANEHLTSPTARAAESSEKTEPHQHSEQLMKLADACRAHTKYHEDRRMNRRNNQTDKQTEDDSSSFFCPDPQDVSDHCRSEISSLSLVLPQVETRYRANTPNSYPVQDIHHICDFYSSVINGMFCPNAPHLFQCGRGGVEGKEDVLAGHTVPSNAPSFLLDSPFLLLLSQYYRGFTSSSNTWPPKPFRT